MSDHPDTVLPMGRYCRSYKLGHHVHWIQGIKSAGATVVIPVSVVVHPSGRVQLPVVGVLEPHSGGYSGVTAPQSGPRCCVVDARMAHAQLQRSRRGLFSLAALVTVSGGAGCGDASCCAGS
jgi:hypothetical protein